MDNRNVIMGRIEKLVHLYESLKADLFFDEKHLSPIIDGHLTYLSELMKVTEKLDDNNPSDLVKLVEIRSTLSNKYFS